MLIENGNCKNYPSKIGKLNQNYKSKKNKINLLVTSPMNF